ncbi:MAG: ABC transporter ATP-binding protein [Chloroflexi bacterium]|nr:MAG: ABC transporter ATP-binding protein [Chloroflexota bacterium]
MAKSTNGNPNIIQTRNLTKEFNGEVAVNNLSFEVPQGRIFGLIGPSGCGKTTTVRLLTGVYRPTAGGARVLGEDPQRFSQTARSKIGYMLQHSVLYPDLTVWENINFASAIYGIGPRRGKQLRRALEFVELDEHRHKAVNNISGGMQRRLSLAATLAHDPALLFLDEPTTGVDPVLRRKFWDHFDRLRNEGRTPLVTTQYVGAAASCDLVAVMQNGRLLFVDTPRGLRLQTYGGELVDLRATDYFDPRVFDSLVAVEGVRDIRRVDASHLRLVVEDAGVVMPRLVEWSQAQGISLQSVEEYQPPFDDVFVHLIEQQGSDSHA